MHVLNGCHGEIRYKSFCSPGETAFLIDGQPTVSRAGAGGSGGGGAMGGGQTS